MGVSADPDSGSDKPRNIELNVVPFIDLMSCLTAFLLVAAVWSQYAQINIKPKGLGQVAWDDIDVEIDIHAAVLLTESQMFVGLSTGERHAIPNQGGGYDWEALEETLRHFKQLPAVASERDIEIAAEDNVSYQAVISAMDTAIAAEFSDVGFVDPSALSVRFHE